MAVIIICVTFIVIIIVVVAAAVAATVAVVEYAKTIAYKQFEKKEKKTITANS